MIDWAPIRLPDLRRRVAQGEARMSEADRRLWNAMRIEPQKWRQHPYGDAGGGFWVVALIGRTVLWYNDIDDGFNRSCFTDYGTIDDYWRNTDELDTAVAFLASSIEHGVDLVQFAGDDAIRRTGRKR
jgi:hypothetical protein